MIDNRIVQCKCCNRLSSECFIKDGLCITCYEYNKQLKQQLAEKQKTIDEINKEFVQAIHDWKTLCAEKDKEIEDWKQKTQTFLNRVNEQNYEIANNNPKQLAIQELEKVKNFVDGRTYCADYIKKRIKELEGE